MQTAPLGRDALIYAERLHTMSDPSPTEAEAPNWKAVAKAYGMEIPAAELERLAPTLDALVAACRATTGADLGLVEPAGSFRPEEPRRTP